MKLQFIISGIIVLFLFNPHLYAFSQNDSGEFQVAKHGGQLSPVAHPCALRAQKVFDRLKPVADKHSDRYPELHLVDSDELFAKSIIDGSILISRKALEFCYCFDDQRNRVDRSCLKTIRSNMDCPLNSHAVECIGDSRLAFVLGHELAHLAFGDHGYGAQELYSTKNTTTKNSNEFIECEHRADAYGIIYATMAGYRSFEDIQTQNRNFFQEWLNQLPTYKKQCLNHPLPKLRLSNIQDHMKRVIHYLNFFHMGNRLLYTGKYEKAIDFLLKFRTKYPGREVYNNIGCANYQLAIQELMKYQPEIVKRFYLSTPVDIQSGLDCIKDSRPVVSKALQISYQIEFNRKIKNAIDSFKYASTKDPYYIPSVTNLSSCYIVKQKYNLAFAETIKAGKTNNISLLNNRALSEYLSTKEVEAPMCNLAKIINNNPDFYPACFNLTQMMKENKEMTNNFSCAEIITKSYSICHMAQENADKNPDECVEPDSLFIKPIQTGEITNESMDYLSKMKCQSDKLSYTVDFYSNTNNNVLVIGTRVEIIESILKPPFMNASVLKNYKKPKRIFHTPSGIQVHVYENIAVEITHDQINGVLFFE